jgi:hypothetical protein
LEEYFIPQGDKMKKESTKRDAALYFLPFILGSSHPSRRMARRIHRRYGIISLILDEKPRLPDLLGLSFRFLPCLSKDEPRLMCEQLIALAEQEPAALPILIPASPQYEQAVKYNKALLEKHFVISSPRELFVHSPLADIH